MTKQEIFELLNDLSLEEKLGEVSQIAGFLFKTDVELTGEINSGYTPEQYALAGSTLGICNPETIIKMQKLHMEAQPHNIPMLFMADIIHGYSTIFPIPLAQGCSFDAELVEKISKLTAMETAPSGLHIVFSPMVDLVHDARWGRVAESYSEDVLLNSIMAEAAVKGYQGESLTDEGTVGACVKHYAAYGAPEGGREYGVVDISERNLRQNYLPPYKAACDAGSAMLMSGFNAVGGDPASGSKKLLSDILRDEWKWDGTVISDWSSVLLMKSHGISNDRSVLAELAIKGRIGIEMCSTCYMNGIQKLLDDGKITMADLDRIVLDVLLLKNKLGLFENPYRFADSEKLKATVDLPETREEARKAIAQTSVLIKNDDKILPLDPNQGKIAFIGPYLDNSKMLGCWVIRGITRPTAETVKSVLERKYKDKNFAFSNGCMVYGEEQKMEVEFNSVQDEMMNNEDREEWISRAVEVAKDCDTVVLLLGEHVTSGGELSSHAFINIPDIQMELFRRVNLVNKNIVTVLFNQRPLDIRELSAKSKAILDVWFPGTMGAEAIVDMLFGELSPSGRLSMSFPYAVGQCPIYYNPLPTDHSIEHQTHFATGYNDCPNVALYPFGYGLGYTEFEYGELKLDKETIDMDGTVTAEIEITNTGDRDGLETVQLYTRDMEASVSRPTKELKGVKKVFIPKGETVKVSFEIKEEMLRIYDVNMNYVTEPGEFRVFIGHDSLVEDYKTFIIK